MKLDIIQSLFSRIKENTLSHRYITSQHINQLIGKTGNDTQVAVIGQSVLDEPINSITIGKGPKKLFMWSQMHGNESTTTKAIFDLLNTLQSGNESIKHILNTCTVCIIPMLNPDGAKAYTRVNANEVDLNRDAQVRSQPESQILRSV